MRWSDTTIHLIDFEGNLTSGILEYGVVTLRDGRISGTDTRLCGAIGRLRSSDTALHGIAEADVRRCAPFAEDFEKFALLRESGPLGAHYAHAENSLIKSVWPYPRLSRDFSRPQSAAQGATTLDWGPWIDTGRLYAQFFPALNSGRLEELVSVFQLEAELVDLAVKHCPANRRNYHAALFDALAAALLLLNLGRRPEFAEMTLPWLLQMSTVNPQKRASLQQDELF
ncbi:MAG TPA: 3'-5' exonuclease [Opitutaceae bacterium]|nr:3'-5' exonuclease [Opitutaceae bacterium]